MSSSVIVITFLQHIRRILLALVVVMAAAFSFSTAKAQSVSDKRGIIPFKELLNRPVKLRPEIVTSRDSAGVRCIELLGQRTG